MPRDCRDLSEQQLLAQNLPRGRRHPVDKAAEIAYGKLDVLVQQAIRLYLYYITRDSGIVIDLEPVHPPVLQYFYRSIYPADYQIADYIYYLLLECLLRRILALLDLRRGILTVYREYRR